MSYNQNIDRMFIEYKVYRKMSDLKPFISRDELPSCQIMGKKKFVGKKAKIEAVYRLTGKRLSEDYTTEQINNYLTVELFNTSLWHKYRKIYNEVSNEKEVVVENYNYQYTLVVELENKSNPLLDEEKIIHFVICELLGTPCEMYKGLKNPIISLRKDYDR
ncbi:MULTISPECIES: hypothetical protein [Bacteroidaceae]|jgi:hypothetical protein|uniref:Uncharacterized protein n=1 Tax=Bacteroides uniformis TaxID=820 RepID=A0A412JBH4_BACUN|nr:MULTISPECIES: hypothetical protein [Bacteroidaceae]RGS49637.1 hypothetical protein DWX87_20645 [Bacteroides uniformis]RGS54290.1 hypothetical protein DWX85_21210 [Phocaeicola vulgatus]